MGLSPCVPGSERRHCGLGGGGGPGSLGAPHGAQESLNFMQGWGGGPLKDIKQESDFLEDQCDVRTRRARLGGFLTKGC